MYSFMYVGGILPAILAIRILVSGGWKEERGGTGEVGAVSIAFPLLMDPGAVTTLLVFSQTSGIAVTVCSVMIVMAITRIVLRFIDKICKILGGTGSAVVARLMAIFIASIAVELVIGGIKHSFP